MKSIKTAKTKSKEIDLGPEYADPANAKHRITFWLDGDILLALRAQAAEVGAGYQTYMNKVLRDAVMGKGTLASRIEALEEKLSSKVV